MNFICNSIRILEELQGQLGICSFSENIEILTLSTPVGGVHQNGDYTDIGVHWHIEATFQ
jgi:hypothetical protein